MRIEDAIKAAENNVAAELGRVMLEIGKISAEAKKLFEQDLDKADMGLDKLYAALYAHAEKNQQGRSWGCGVFEITPENPVVKVILDFYHMPAEWIGGKTANSQAVGRTQSDAINLMDLL